MNKKISFLAAGVALAMAACSPGVPTAPTAAPKPADPAKPAAPAQQAPAPAPAAGGNSFNGAWPYSIPPEGHFNAFNSAKQINLGIYAELIQQPLAMFKWADSSYAPALAEKWENKGSTFEVTLRDAKWSDGKAVTSADVVNTFVLRRLQNTAEWKYLGGIEAKGDKLVVFNVKTPSSLMERLVLRTQIRDSQTYGAIAAKAAALYAGGKDHTSDEGKAIAKELSDLRPAGWIASGPYNIDVKSLTESLATLPKNANAWNASKVKFDKLLIYQGETAAVTPLVLQGDVDYATHGFPPATEKSFVDQGIRIQRSPLFTGPGLYFNYDVAPLDKPAVRQAIAQAIRRDISGQAALGQSGVAVKLMAGVSDNVIAQWMSADDIAKLNKYEYNVDKAAETMKAAGFTKGGDGIWADASGKKLEFELSFPSDFADWSASAETVVNDLNKFGFKITPRGVQSQQHLADVNAGKFQMAYRAWGTANPHPFYSYEQDLFVHNYVRTGAAGKGMNMPLKQKTSKGDIDLEKLALDTGVGTDAASQKKIVTELAMAYNELLPQVQIFERYGNNPMRDKRVNWLPADNAIFKNPHQVDPFTTIMIQEGMIGGK